jgi:hypothetical protein
MPFTPLRSVKATGALRVRGRCIESMKFNSISPKKVSQAVKSIAQQLGINEDDARLLKFQRPNEFNPELNNCFFNVWVKMKFSGGGKQYGWLIAQDSRNEFIEAQFHAVWIDQNGGLVDVTPRPDTEKRVMFIPDHVRNIQLSDSNGQPAILSYDNFRILRDQTLAELERIKVVMQDTSFIKEHGLSWL